MSIEARTIRTDDGTEQAVITLRHPNGGVSEVTASIATDGRLDVSVDTSKFNAATVDVDQVTVVELEANR